MAFRGNPPLGNSVDFNPRPFVPLSAERDRRIVRGKGPARGTPPHPAQVWTILHHGIGKPEIGDPTSSPHLDSSSAADRSDSDTLIEEIIPDV
ncbi:hypothetical protein RRG08_049725 [Elysia crispata]|uniref:Uncharacterized protein n=1 Tax=Elysia crispata TaxID=231223 RepID=A0AAE0Y829_9GAST|nr:hypothetical protein RRG08_049725 [Elysia crispata]